MRYARRTGVNPERSRTEIERTLVRYGAAEFIYGARPDQAIIQFKFAGRIIRFALPLGGWVDFKVSPAGKRRRDSAAQTVWAQDVRQRYRALALVLKAKLEAVEAGITTFEQEFYAHILLPNNKTVYEETSGNVALAYKSGTVPMALGFDDKGGKG